MAAIYAGERVMASRMALDNLEKACDRALFDLLCGLGRAEQPADVRVGLLAAEVLRLEIDELRRRFTCGNSLEGAQSVSFCQAVAGMNNDLKKRIYQNSDRVKRKEELS